MWSPSLSTSLFSFTKWQMLVEYQCKVAARYLGHSTSRCHFIVFIAFTVNLGFIRSYWHSPMLFSVNLFLILIWLSSFFSFLLFLLHSKFFLILYTVFGLSSYVYTLSVYLRYYLAFRIYLISGVLLFPQILLLLYLALFLLRVAAFQSISCILAYLFLWLLLFFIAFYTYVYFCIVVTVSNSTLFLQLILISYILLILYYCFLFSGMSCGIFHFKVLDILLLQYPFFSLSRRNHQHFFHYIFHAFFILFHSSSTILFLVLTISPRFYFFLLFPFSLS